MNTKSEKSDSTPPKKSLIFAIEDVAKLLRTEVKKTEMEFKPAITSQMPDSRSASPELINNLEQIAKFLRTQIAASRSRPQKKYVYGIVKKPRTPPK
jgi:hypothetical protein